MSVVKNIKPSDLVIPNKSDDVDEYVEKKESLLMDHIQFSLKPERLNIRFESPTLFQPQHCDDRRRKSLKFFPLFTITHNFLPPDYDRKLLPTISYYGTLFYFG